MSRHVLVGGLMAACLSSIRFAADDAGGADATKAAPVLDGAESGGAVEGSGVAGAGADVEGDLAPGGEYRHDFMPGPWERRREALGMAVALEQHKPTAGNAGPVLENAEKFLAFLELAR